MLDVPSQGLMSDFEDSSFCVESWTLPKKKKRKNESKKHKKGSKRKKESGQKNKENDAMKLLQFNDTVKINKKTNEKGKKKKDDKKAKKKRKKKLELDCFTFMQVTGAQAKYLEEPAALKPCQDKKVNPDEQDHYSKKTKIRKMVAFALSPVDISIKHLKFASSPKEMKAVTEDESCSQVSVTGQIQPHDGDSQCNSDEINSQDLFITQKTFRASPVEPSSSEASDRFAAASPQVFKQQNEAWHKAEGEIKHPQSSCFHQMYGTPRQLVREPKMVDKAEDKRIHERLQLEKTSFQTQTKLKAKLAGEKKAFRSNVANPFLNEPVINPTPVVSSSQCASSFLPHIDELSPLPPCKVSTSTQTDNFFTSELSSYLSFCQRNRTTVHLEDEKPLDLSFQQRARKDLCLSVNISVMDVGNDAETLHLQKRALRPGKLKDGEVKDSSGESKTAPSPQSHADLRSADVTTSSEDDHHSSTGRRDPSKVKRIQTKLNKPFFFKPKGEERSPRPESPLMKFSPDIEVRKHKKRH